MSLAEPYALLWLMPAIAAWWWFRSGRGLGVIVLPGDWFKAIEKPLHRFMASTVTLGAALPIALYVGIWALLTVTLARPNVEVAEPSNYANLVGRVIVIDLGAGANIHRQRLTATKLLDASEGVPTALVLATGDAFDAVPLTTDRAYLERYLQVIKPDVMPTGGRSLYVALAHSEGVLSRAGVAAGQVVLISGGSPPAQRVAPAKQWRRFFVVAEDEVDSWMDTVRDASALLSSDQDLAAATNQLDQLIAELRLEDEQQFTDLRPCLIALAMLLWLLLFRRRRVA